MEKYTDYILWIYLFTLVIKNRKKPKKKKKLQTVINSYLSNKILKTYIKSNFH